MLVAVLEYDVAFLAVLVAVLSNVVQLEFLAFEAGGVGADFAVEFFIFVVLLEVAEEEGLFWEEFLANVAVVRRFLVHYAQREKFPLNDLVSNFRSFLFCFFETLFFDLLVSRIFEHLFKN